MTKVRRKGRDTSWIPKSAFPAAIGLYIIVTEMSKQTSNPALVALGALMCNALPVAVLQSILENSFLAKGKDDEEGDADA